ncbi:MAG TPA: hypothetical protein VM934_03875 [Pyrinomonadaceae bacterium]|nr:hypothetical protein [Pyrinomonadaceae bacterium]
MKIPPTTNTPATKVPESNKTTTKRGVAQANESAGDDATTTAPAETEGRDFASVLEEVSRTERRQDREVESEGDSKDSKRPEKSEREAVERREERRGEDGGGRGGGGFDRAPGGVREIGSPTDAASARAILHIADLERIVSAVRTQLLAGGRHEVTIELRRSVLEGLQVKLSAGADGRVTAEFIAASERVRAQIDARASELADIMRSRGINLASLNTTTVSADASGQNYSPDDNSHRREPSGATGASQGATAGESREEINTGDGGDTGTTYRA